MKLELAEGESLEVSAHTPMYNPSHVLPLKQPLIHTNFFSRMSVLKEGFHA